MPRGRKPNATRTSAVNQATLSFNNKVTKPGTRSHKDEHTASAKKLSGLEESLTQDQPEVTEFSVQNEPGQSQPKAEQESDSETEPIIEQEPKSSRSGIRRKAGAPQGKDERALAAEKITDTQLKKYWQDEEDSRLAPRVHQSHLSLHEKILRHFDLSSQFGPCIGISRLSRWRRANTLGLAPPLEVLAVLLREEEGAGTDTMRYTGKGRSQGCGKMAYVDELAGGRVVLVD